MPSAPIHSHRSLDPPAFASRALAMVWNAALYGGADACLKLLQMGSLTYLAMICSKDQYGRLGLLFSLQQLITLLVLGGFVEAVTGRLNEDRGPAAVAALFRRGAGRLGLSALLVAAVYLLAVQFGWRSLLPEISPAVAVPVLASGLLLAAYLLLASFHQLRESHPTAVFFRSLPAMVGYGCGLLFASLASDPLGGFFLGAMVGLLLGLPIAARSVHRAGIPPVDADRAAAARLHRESVPYLLIALIGWFSGYGNTLLIKGFFTDAEIGQYLFVCNYSFSILLVINAFSQVWTPRFVRLASHVSPERLNDLSNAFYRLHAIAVSCIAGGIVLLYRESLHWLKGNAMRYEAGLPYVALMLAGYVAMNYHCQSAGYFYLHKQGKLLLRVSVWTSLVGVVGWCALMWILGPIGIYLGFFGTLLFRSAATYWAARRRWGVDVSEWQIGMGLGMVALAWLLAASDAPLAGRLAIYLIAVLASAASGLPAARVLRRSPDGGSGLQSHALASTPASS